MLDPDLFKSCSEIHQVEQTIEVVVGKGSETRLFRIEAIRNLRTGICSTRAYYMEHVLLQPVYPIVDGKFEREPDEFEVWVRYTDLPWTEGPSAESVLQQALGFLQP